MSTDDSHEIPSGEERFPWLYSARNRPLRRFFLKRVPDPQDAEDLFAETWRRAVAHPELAVAKDPRAFLFGIAWNVLREYRRGVKSRKRLADNIAQKDVVDGPRTPEEFRIQEETVMRVRKAIAALPSMMGKVIAYMSIYGKSREETAVLCGISEDAVRYLLPIARARLKRILTNTRGSESDATHRR